MQPEQNTAPPLLLRAAEAAALCNTSASHLADVGRRRQNPPAGAHRTRNFLAAGRTEGLGRRRLPAAGKVAGLADLRQCRHRAGKIHRFAD